MAIKFVSTTGSDATGTGSQSAPWRTFARAFASTANNPNRVVAGDTLYIRGGTYPEQLDLQANQIQGAAGAFITIAGFPDDGVRAVRLNYADTALGSYGPIKCRGNLGWYNFENFILDGIGCGDVTGWAIRDGNHDFNVRDLEIVNFMHNGILVQTSRNPSNILIERCIVHDSRAGAIQSALGSNGRWYGFYLNVGNGVTVQDCHIYNMTGAGFQIYPGSVSNGGPLQNVTIRRNNIHHNNLQTAPANLQFGGMVVGTNSTSTDIVNNINVYNNLIYLNFTGFANGDPLGSGQTGGTGHGIRIQGHPSNVNIWNNTVYANGNAAGIAFDLSQGTPTGVVIQNNILYNNTLGSITGTTPSGTTIDHNLTTDPLFVNGSGLTPNLQLSGTSPAINAGVNLSAFTTDFTNTTRVGIYDIGAYEVTADVTAPLAPTGVMVL
jgi:hypothetical protein